MPILTKPYAKANLKRGMRFRLIVQEPKLYCNDNYQYGLEIEHWFNDATKDVGTGKIASGTLDGEKPLEFVRACSDPNYQNYVYVLARQIGGRLDGQTVEFMLHLDLLSERFELV